MSAAAQPQRVAIVGGGLAGLAAAVALLEHAPPQTPLQIELFEARRRLGGRATSYEDEAGGMLVDHCQHVSMGCCTNLADLARRCGLADLFQRSDRLHFITPDGRRHDFAAVGWLPAPLHLLPGFLRMRFLPLGDRVRVLRGLARLIRYRAAVATDEANMADWLSRQGQSPAAIRRFWSVVLVSALGDVPERVSVSAARKVFVSGFLAAREAYRVEVPRVALDELYGWRLAAWLKSRGAAVHLSAAVRGIDRPGDAARFRLTFYDGSERRFDQVVPAVPWHKAAGLLPAEIADRIPKLREASRLAAAPISGIHLWFAAPITPLPHAVLLDTLGQWVFCRGRTMLQDGDRRRTAYYVQVVVSGAHHLASLPRDEVPRIVRAELAAAFPESAQVELLRWRSVTEQQAVFSPAPGSEAARPRQETPVHGLTLAGDWTASGWPATMEGAVRSGYLAAEAVLRAAGAERRIVVPDLPRGVLARLLLGTED